eukprot:m.38096 g.38096  ORF g.38096 m.38096 type:complete len:105 (-) comp9931_c0_seq1:547-861(-)
MCVVALVQLAAAAGAVDAATMHVILVKAWTATDSAPVRRVRLVARVSPRGAPTSAAHHASAARVIVNASHHNAIQSSASAARFVSLAISLGLTGVRFLSSSSPT